MADTVPNPWLNEYFNRYRQGGIGWRPSRPLKICFLVASLGMSGGNAVIIEHAEFLATHGVDVTIVVTERDPTDHPNWHPALAALRARTVEDVADEVFDIAIATWWPTIYELPRLKLRHAAYFVQSIESRFYAQDSGYEHAARAELTYSLGIPCIVVARWIEMYLALEYETPSFLVRNGIAKDRYAPTGPAIEPRRPGRIRALVEGNLDSPMKACHEAIELSREAGFDEIWLMTPTRVDKVPGVDRVFSRVPVDQTALIYRSTDVLVKLSQVEGMYGPPLEMFHCGGTVVSWDVTGCEEYVLDGINGVVCAVGDYQRLRAALRQVATDSDFLAQLKAGALRTAEAWPDWDGASQNFYAYLFGIASGAPIDQRELAMRIAGAPRTLSIMREERVRAGAAWMTESDHDLMGGTA